MPLDALFSPVNGAFAPFDETESPLDGAEAPLNGVIEGSSRSSPYSSKRLTLLSSFMADEGQGVSSWLAEASGVAAVSALISAVMAAARSGDRSTRRDLVRMLDSDDATTRLLAITTHEQMEGTTLGYDSTASEPERDRAIDAWKARLAAEDSGPATGAGGTL